MLNLLIRRVGSSKPTMDKILSSQSAGSKRTSGVHTVAFRRSPCLTFCAKITQLGQLGTILYRMVLEKTDERFHPFKYPREVHHLWRPPALPAPPRGPHTDGAGTGRGLWSYADQPPGAKPAPARYPHDRSALHPCPRAGG